ncbi:6-phospho-3-hexuloisomerase [Nocardia aobensis]|uniref:6-phospho-3-hexuloisomerase n=1 Tax=Nocardia aobensis TaxID=257277 RepID=A0ABW6P349_9NOCA
MVRQDTDVTEDLGEPTPVTGTPADEVARAQRDVCAEVTTALDAVEPEATLGLVSEIRKAERIFVVGAGRSKLMVDAFAMRLMHLGFRAYVVSDVTTPAIDGGTDLLIACSGSGATPTVVGHVETALEAGARAVALTATADSPLADLAHKVVLIEERSRNGEVGESVQFIGTLFEQCALLYLDAVVLFTEREARANRARMAQRHTNFE